MRTHVCVDSIWHGYAEWKTQVSMCERDDQTGREVKREKQTQWKQGETTSCSPVFSCLLCRVEEEGQSVAVQKWTEDADATISFPFDGGELDYIERKT